MKSSNKTIPFFIINYKSLITLKSFVTNLKTIYGLVNRSQTYMETPCSYMVVENVNKHGEREMRVCK